MGKQVDSQLVETPENPLPISYNTIYECLKDIFPDQALLILNSIKRIVVITKDSAGFLTMGITKDGTLFISKAFWDTHMTDEDHLKTVLMHELMHCVGGDVYTLLTPEDGDDWKERNQADLIAMDARINAFICMSRPDIFPEKFLSSFYNEEYRTKYPIHNVLTPSGVFTNSEKDKKIKEFHDNFYSTEDFCAHHELSEVIYEVIKEQQKSGKTLKIKLLGGHGESGQELTDKDLEGVTHIEIDTSDLENLKKQERSKKNKFRDEGNDSPGVRESGRSQDENDGLDTTAGTEVSDAMDAVKEAIMDMLGEMSVGAGYGTKSAASMIQLATDVTEKFDLKKFKKMMVDNIFHNVRTSARRPVGSYSTSPVMPKKLSMMDTIMLASGITPLLWKTKRMTYKFDNALLPIYLDVSGSTQPYLPRIVKLLTNIANEIEYVWGFSNTIEKHTIEELGKGIIKGTGGTDFDCVINHAVAQGYKHIVVISDGEAWCRFDRNDWDGTSTLEKVPEIKSAVTVLFGYARKNNYFSRAYENTHMIEEVIV